MTFGPVPTMRISVDNQQTFEPKPFHHMIPLTTQPQLQSREHSNEKVLGHTGLRPHQLQRPPRPLPNLPLPLRILQPPRDMLLLPTCTDPRPPSKRLAPHEQQSAPTNPHLVVQRKPVRGGSVDAGRGRSRVAQDVERAEVGLCVFVALWATIARLRWFTLHQDGCRGVQAAPRRGAESGAWARACEGRGADWAGCGGLNYPMGEGEGEGAGVVYYLTFHCGGCCVGYVRRSVNWKMQKLDFSFDERCQCH
jgi:hypothetical protein